MSRKISKNSRAARQAEAYEPVAKSLADLPRAQKTDLTNILVRTAARNEALLNAKINKKRKEKGKINKKALEQKLLESANLMEKDKIERALKVTNRLDGKIAKSISRARYVQSARKAGWESTNLSIRRELEVQTSISIEQSTGDEPAKSKKSDEMQDDVFETFGDVEGDDDLENNNKEEPKQRNMFELLFSEYQEE